MNFHPSEGKKPRQLLQLLGLYSVLWLVCAVCIHAIFRVNGKLFLYCDDGVYQHFPAFDYLCQFLRSLLIEHKPMGFFNYTIGQGADLVTTLSAYGFTDPVYILAALVIPLTRVQRFTLMIFLKLYLVGLSFIVYCQASEKKNLPAVLAGAIAYAFSGVVLFTMARHPCHINWAYFFPLLLAGVEFYVRRDRRIPLILFVFLNILTSYYTFYMNAVLTVLYVLVCGLCRIYGEEPRSTWKAELKTGFSIAGLFVIGILLSSFVLFPIIHAFLNNPRVMEVTGYTASSWHYEWSYYANLFIALFEPRATMPYYSMVGFNTVVFLPLALLFFKKGHVRLKALLILWLVMLCLPIAGRVMNGMSYACNRWSYAAVFYGTFALVELIDDLKELSPEEKSRMGILAATYGLIVLFLIKSDFRNNALFAVLVLGWTVLVFVLLQNGKKTALGGALVCLSLAGALFQVYFTFSRNAGYYAGDFLDYELLDASYANYSSTAAAGLSDGFFRIEEADQRPNKDGFNGVNGTGLAWSLVPSGYLEYSNGLGLDAIYEVHMFFGLDGRSGLLDLASVKYYTRPASAGGLVPWGFEEIESPDGAFRVYENRNALPIGYTYDRVLSRGEYETLSGPEKEQALMQAAVLDEVPPGWDASDLAELSVGVTDLEYEITGTNGAEWSDQRLNAEADGSISFSAEVPEDCEIYMLLKGARAEGKPNKIWLRAARSIGDYAAESWVDILTTNESWYFDRDTVVFNLGPGHAGRNDFSLTVHNASSMDLEDLRIVAVPMTVYEEAAWDRAEYVLEDVVVGSDRVTGKIRVPEKRILQFSIPCSVGWRASVDGTETPLLRSGVLYMALPLEAGEHSILLTYSTPYARLGGLVSGLTLVSFCVYEVVTRRKQRQS